jgi:hypothetical protein
MKKMMSLAIVTLMMAGAAAYACDSCGCSAKKTEEKPACSSCEKVKKCEACTAEQKCEACSKKCETKKADATAE